MMSRSWMRRDDRADAEAELEAERDVGEDADERQHGRPDALAASARWPTVGPTISVPTTLKLPRFACLQRVFDLLSPSCSAMRPTRRRPAARESSPGAAPDRRRLHDGVLPAAG